MVDRSNQAAATNTKQPYKVDQIDTASFVTNTTQHGNEGQASVVSPINTPIPPAQNNPTPPPRPMPNPSNPRPNPSGNNNFDGDPNNPFDPNNFGNLGDNNNPPTGGSPVPRNPRPNEPNFGGGSSATVPGSSSTSTSDIQVNATQSSPSPQPSQQSQASKLSVSRDSVSGQEYLVDNDSMLHMQTTSQQIVQEANQAIANYQEPQYTANDLPNNIAKPGVDTANPGVNVQVSPIRSELPADYFASQTKAKPVQIASQPQADTSRTKTKNFTPQQLDQKINATNNQGQSVQATRREILEDYKQDGGKFNYTQQDRQTLDQINLTPDGGAQRNKPIDAQIKYVYNDTNALGDTNPTYEYQTKKGKTKQVSAQEVVERSNKDAQKQTAKGRDDGAQGQKYDINQFDPDSFRRNTEFHANEGKASVVSPFQTSIPQPLKNTKQPTQVRSSQSKNTQAPVIQQSGTTTIKENVDGTNVQTASKTDTQPTQSSSFQRQQSPYRQVRNAEAQVEQARREHVQAQIDSLEQQFALDEKRANGTITQKDKVDARMAERKAERTKTRIEDGKDSYTQARNNYGKPTPQPNNSRVNPAQTTNPGRNKDNPPSTSAMPAAAVNPKPGNNGGGNQNGGSSNTRSSVKPAVGSPSIDQSGTSRAKTAMNNINTSQTDKIPQKTVAQPTQTGNVDNSPKSNGPVINQSGTATVKENIAKTTATQTQPKPKSVNPTPENQRVSRDNSPQQNIDAFNARQQTRRDKGVSADKAKFYDDQKDYVQFAIENGGMQTEKKLQQEVEDDKYLRKDAVNAYTQIREANNDRAYKHGQYVDQINHGDDFDAVDGVVDYFQEQKYDNSVASRSKDVQGYINQTESTSRAQKEFIQNASENLESINKAQAAYTDDTRYSNQGRFDSYEQIDIMNQHNQSMNESVEQFGKNLNAFDKKIDRKEDVLHQRDQRKNKGVTSAPKKPPTDNNQ